ARRRLSSCSMQRLTGILRERNRLRPRSRRRSAPRLRDERSVGAAGPILGATMKSTPEALGLPGNFPLSGGLVDSHFHMAFLYGAVPVEMDAALGQLQAARDQ